MKRFFASDAESDMLIAEATKTFGLKIGDIAMLHGSVDFTVQVNRHR